MSTGTTIDPQLSVNEILRRYPETIAVFNEFGIDSCCGGAEPLEVAAARDGASLQPLLEALQRAISHAR